MPACLPACLLGAAQPLPLRALAPALTRPPPPRLPCPLYRLLLPLQACRGMRPLLRVSGRSLAHPVWAPPPTRCASHSPP